MDEEYEPCVSEALAEGDAPLATKLVLARESIDVLERKLQEFDGELRELAERIGRGEPVDGEIQRQQDALARLRSATDRKRLIMASYVDQLERARG